jgi:hypothetical protein
MAQNFKREMLKAVGSTSAPLTATDSNDTLVGISCANRIAQQIIFSAYILTGGVPDVLANRYYVIKDAPLPAGSSLQILDGGAKMVLQNTDILRFISDTADSLDVIVSRVDDIST